MRIGSLFSGIGGLELGLERAIPGAHTVFQVEQNPYARAVLAKHWPNAQRYEDVRQAGAHNLPACDLLCGGFPCQDISVAGKRAGINGERSGLWSEYARIIGELRPRFVVVENVSALLTGGMGRVLGDLAACGYDALWDCIPAQSVGAHHRRDRLFIVAWSQQLWAMADAYRHHVEPRRDPRVIPRPPKEVGGHLSQLDPANRGRQDVADADRQREPQQGQLQGEERRRTGDGSSKVANPHNPRRIKQWWPIAVRAQQLATQRSSGWVSEPDVGRVADGVPSRVDRLRCLGNAVVPQVAEVVGRVVMQLEQDHR